MEGNQRDIFLKRFAQLTEPLQEAIISTKTGIAIQDALRLAKLSDEHYDKVMDLVGDVLMLNLSREDFQAKLQQVFNLTLPVAQIINQIIQQKIFEPLKDDLNQLKINRPELTFPKIQQKETIPSREPLETPKAETMKTEGIKELAQKPKPLPDLSLPEIQEIKIERPVNRTGELKRVTVPSVSPEAQEKIHSKLVEAMKKKETKPKIVEEMKKVVTAGIKKTPQQKPKPKTIPETEEIIASQVVGGEGKKFNPQEKIQKSSSQKPYILDVKLKEEEKEQKEETLTEEPIQYKKYQPKKPFGEA